MTKVQKLEAAIITVLLILGAVCFGVLSGVKQENDANAAQYQHCVIELHGRVHNGVCYVDMKSFPRP